MNNIEKGLSFERKCLDQLKQIGFTDLSLTPITDNGADIIGTYKGTKYVFQCKNHKKPQGNRCVQEILAARSFYKANRSVVISNSYFTPKAIELAKSNNCILITSEVFFNLMVFPPADYAEIYRQDYHDFDYDIVQQYNSQRNIFGRTPKWAELDKHLRYLIRKEYGNYSTFLTTMGDLLSSNKPSDDELKSEYMRIRQQIGRTPRLCDIDKFSCFAPNAFKSYPFTKLQKECGDRPNIERGVTKEDLIKAYYSLKNELGHFPKVKEIDEKGEYRSSYYRKKWGDFDTFLKDIGIKRAEFGLKKIYSEDELIMLYALLRIIFKISEKSLTINHTVLENLKYCDSTFISPSTISKRFGSWDNFISYMEAINIDSVILMLEEKLKEAITDRDIAFFSTEKTEVSE